MNVTFGRCQTSVLALCLGVGLSPIAAFAQPRPADEIGVTSASNPATRGTPPQRATRILNIGTNVITRERVQTSDQGSAQLLFFDRSSITIGRNSDLILDEFVYNPADNTGRMAVTMTRGVMRFVGGRLSHQGNVTVTTPTATIGIRGFAGNIVVGQNGETRVMVNYGIANARSHSTGATQQVQRQNFSMTIGSGGSISEPERFTAEDLTQITAQMGSGPGQTGGATSVPTSAQVQSAGVGQANTNVAANQVVAPTPSGAQQTPAQQSSSSGTSSGSSNSQTQTNQNDSRSIITGQTQSTPPSSLTSSPPPPPPAASPPPPPLPPLQQAFYRLQFGTDAANLGQGSVPFLVTEMVGPGNFYVSPAYAIRFTNGTGTSDTNRPNSGYTRTIQAGLQITGAGAAQRSTIYLLATGFDRGTGDYAALGGITATGRLQSNFRMARSNGAVSSIPGTVTVDQDTLLPNSYTVNTNDYFNGYVNSNNFVNPSGVAPGRNYTFNISAQRVDGPLPLPSDRTSQTLNGYVGGLVDSIDFSSPSDPNGVRRAPFEIGNTSNSPQVVAIQTTAGNGRVQANFQVVRLADLGATGQSFNSGNLQFGNVTVGDVTRNGFISDTLFGARNGVTGNNTFSGQEISTINGSALDRANFVQQGLMVTGELVNAQSFFPGVTFCQCDYTRWGFWSFEFTVANSGVNGPRTSHRSHLSTWVAGRLPTVAEIPTVGTATYSGHIIGAFASSGSQYVAAGSFQNAVNFATRTGAITITGLDGRNYAGSVAATALNPRDFAGSIASTSGPAASGALAGSFFRGAGGPAHEMGGRFGVAGASYLGSGVFAARRP